MGDWIYYRHFFSSSSSHYLKVISQVHYIFHLFIFRELKLLCWKLLNIILCCLVYLTFYLYGGFFHFTFFALYEIVNKWFVLYSLKWLPSISFGKWKKDELFMEVLSIFYTYGHKYLISQGAFHGWQCIQCEWRNWTKVIQILPSPASATLSLPIKLNSSWLPQLENTN